MGIVNFYKYFEKTSITSVSRPANICLVDASIYWYAACKDSDTVFDARKNFVKILFNLLYQEIKSLVNNINWFMMAPRSKKEGKDLLKMLQSIEKTKQADRNPAERAKSTSRLLDEKELQLIHFYLLKKENLLTIKIVLDNEKARSFMKFATCVNRELRPKSLFSGKYFQFDLAYIMETFQYDFINHFHSKQLDAREIHMIKYLIREKLLPIVFVEAQYDTDMFVKNLLTPLQTQDGKFENLKIPEEISRQTAREHDASPSTSVLADRVKSATNETLRSCDPRFVYFESGDRKEMSNIVIFTSDSDFLALYHDAKRHAMIVTWDNINSKLILLNFSLNYSNPDVVFLGEKIKQSLKTTTEATPALVMSNSTLVPEESANMNKTKLEEDSNHLWELGIKTCAALSPNDFLTANLWDVNVAARLFDSTVSATEGSVSEHHVVCVDVMNCCSKKRDYDGEIKSNANSELPPPEMMQHRLREYDFFFSYMRFYLSSLELTDRKLKSLVNNCLRPFVIRSGGLFSCLSNSNDDPNASSGTSDPVEQRRQVIADHVDEQEIFISIFDFNNCHVKSSCTVELNSADEFLADLRNRIECILDTKLRGTFERKFKIHLKNKILKQKTSFSRVMADMFKRISSTTQSMSNSVKPSTTQSLPNSDVSPKASSETSTGNNKDRHAEDVDYEISVLIIKFVLIYLVNIYYLWFSDAIDTNSSSVNMLIIQLMKTFHVDIFNNNKNKGSDVVVDGNTTKQQPCQKNGKEIYNFYHFKNFLKDTIAVFFSIYQ